MMTARIASTLTAFAIAGFAAALTPFAAQAQPNQHMEVIHHPNYNKAFFMPFVPGIKIKSGKILWLAGPPRYRSIMTTRTGAKTS